MAFPALLFPDIFFERYLELTTKQQRGIVETSVQQDVKEYLTS